MAEEVAHRLRAGGIAFIEAGTGTGKSLGYLIPLGAHLLDEDPEGRAVVATYTLPLQDQLLRHDVALAEKALGRALPVALAKGWGNYLCLLRLDHLARGQHDWLEGLAEEQPPRPAIDELIRWSEGAGDQGRAHAGTWSELPPGRWEAVWPLVAAEPDRCPRRRCPLYEACFYHVARRRMLESRLVLTNQHLLLADLALRREADSGEAAVLPPFSYLVVDEAHHLEDVAVSHLGVELSSEAVLARLRRLTRGRSRLLGEPARAALAVLERLFHALRRGLERAAPGMAAGTARTPGAVQHPARLTPGMAETLCGPALLGEAEEALEEVASRAEQLAQRMAGQEGDGEERAGSHAAADLVAVARWARRAARDLEAVTSAQAEGYVFWMEAASRAPGLVLRAAPLDVGPVLAAELFGAVRSAILTSATLADGPAGFLPLRRRLGLASAGNAPAGDGPSSSPASPAPAPWAGEAQAEWDEDGAVMRVVVGVSGAPPVVRREEALTECVIPSPFDFRSQALVAVPSDFPAPDRPGFVERLAELSLALAVELGGRLLVLFTSHRMMAETWKEMEALPAAGSVRVLVQGGASRTALLDAFREARGEGMVLMGADSFWEGVDLPGPTLSCVVLARLPFPVPDHPLVRARVERISEQGGDPFWEESVPRAVTRFRQGFGRLIRTRQDRGAVVVADPRLLTRSYRHRFLDLLPRSSLIAGPAHRIVREVVEWTRPSLPSS